MENKRLNQRLNSCREVLQAINQMLHQHSYSHKVLEQMDQLERLMVALDGQIITEEDMQRIEFSTNQLFDELTRLFAQTGLNKLNQPGWLH